MHEHKVIAAILESREAYESVADWIAEKDFTAKGWVLISAARDYYKRDATAQAVDREILLARIGRKLSSEKALAGFTEVLDKLPVDIGAKNVAQELLTVKRDAAADRLAQSLSARSGADDSARVKLLEEYTALREAASLETMTQFEEYAPSVTDLFTKVLDDSNRIKLAPPALNDRLDGGPLPGHFIVVHGRVEMGKSICAINMAVGFLAQGKSVLYMENEDPLSDTRRRITQRLLRRTRRWIQANPEEAERMAQERGIDRLHLIDGLGTARELKAAIQKIEPQCVVINQMRNMAQGDNSVQLLDSLAWSLRDVAKKTQVVMVGITASKEGEVTKEGTIRPKPVLETGDVYSSKTGIPAAADLLIGWGGSDKLKHNEMACISITKNKLVDGNMTADGKFRKYGHFYVKVNPETGVVYTEETAA